MIINLASAHGCVPYHSRWFGVGVTKIVDALASDELSKLKFLLLWVCIFLRMTLHQTCTLPLLQLIPPWHCWLADSAAYLGTRQPVQWHRAALSSLPFLLLAIQEGSNLTLSIGMCISPSNLRANIMLLTLGVLGMCSRSPEFSAARNCWFRLNLKFSKASDDSHTCKCIVLLFLLSLNQWGWAEEGF